MKKHLLPEPVLILSVFWETREYLQPPDLETLCREDFIMISRGEIWNGETPGIFPNNKPALELLIRRMERLFQVNNAPQTLWLARYELQLDLPNVAQPDGLSHHLPRLAEVLYRVIANPYDTDDLDGYWDVLFSDPHVVLREKVNGKQNREIWFGKNHGKPVKKYILRTV